VAYSNTVSDPVIRTIDGRKHVTVTITEEEVGTTDEWEIGVPEFFTLTLFEAELETAGDASTIDPDLGLAASFVADTLDEVVQNTTAGVHVRNQSSVRVTATGRVLRGRSTPDVATGATGVIVTRVTYVEGHI
jgi:hypothetical protein